MIRLRKENKMYDTLYFSPSSPAIFERSREEERVNTLMKNNLFKKMSDDLNPGLGTPEEDRVVSMAATIANIFTGVGIVDTDFASVKFQNGRASFSLGSVHVAVGYKQMEEQEDFTDEVKVDFIRSNKPAIRFFSYGLKGQQSRGGESRYESVTLNGKPSAIFIKSLVAENSGEFNMATKLLMKAQQMRIRRTLRNEIDW